MGRPFLGRGQHGPQPGVLPGEGIHIILLSSGFHGPHDIGHHIGPFPHHRPGLDFFHHSPGHVLELRHVKAFGKVQNQGFDILPAANAVPITGNIQNTGGDVVQKGLVGRHRGGIDVHVGFPQGFHGCIDMLPVVGTADAPDHGHGFPHAPGQGVHGSHEPPQTFVGEKCPLALQLAQTLGHGGNPFLHPGRHLIDESILESGDGGANHLDPGIQQGLPGLNDILDGVFLVKGGEEAGFAGFAEIEFPGHGPDLGINHIGFHRGRGIAQSGFLHQGQQCLAQGRFGGHPRVGHHPVDEHPGQPGLIVVFHQGMAHGGDLPVFIPDHGDEGRILPQGAVALLIGILGPHIFQHLFSQVQFFTGSPLPLGGQEPLQLGF